MKIAYPDIDFNGMRALFIDIDNTLYAYEPCHQKALTACYDHFSSTPLMPKIIFDTFCKDYFVHRTLIKDRLFPQGVCRSRLLAFQSYFEGLNIPAPYTYAVEFDSIYWDTFITNMTPSADALRTLQTAKKLGLKIIAVTDMITHIQSRKITALGMEPFIDALVTSEEAGIEKPSPIIFNLALKKAGVSAFEALMIGDDLEKDIKGAQQLGIRAYQVTIDST